MSDQSPHGVIAHTNSLRRTDFLYRISLKCMIQNKQGEVLVVKESGRNYWDLPGGGMDHGESLKTAIAREMHEEVQMQGDFTFRIIDTDEPALLTTQNFWQLRLIFVLFPDSLLFKPGDDGDAIAFINPADFKESSVEIERRIWRYAQLALTPPARTP